ncbi:MAG: DUF1697 domain-containing protein [Thermoleophilia bacterium]
MARVVALLRGVNVGGRRLAMATLRDGLARAGCDRVETYVQSGNVVLVPPEPAPDDLAGWLEARIGELAGFPVPVVLRTAAELAAVVAASPYPQAGGAQLHVSFYREAPVDLLAGIDLAAFAPGHATLVGRDLYLHLPDGMGRAALPAALARAGGTATTRNWNTVLRLAELAASST